MKCEEVREALPAYARDRNASLSMRRHIAGCPDCKAELARYDELLAGLRTMRTETAAPPPGLVAALAAIPANESRLRLVRTHVARNRKAYVGGIALVAAGAAGAAVWRSRARAAAA
jgi:hypothetical protein